MTAVKSKIEFRTVLDFPSEEPLSRNRVQTKLRAAEVTDAELAPHSITYINNQIKVGMYTIRLVFPDSSEAIDGGDIRHRLNQYGAFIIRISENNPVNSGDDKYDFLQEIDITKDRRFKCQPWAHNMLFNMGDLVNVIIHCHRLDKLKVFL